MADLVRSLRLFRDIIEQGSFSALARQRNLSHTTVARAIDDLEAHFRTRLFRRSTRNLTLTPDGERLIGHAMLILDQLEQAETDLTGAATAKGLVRVGVTTALGLYYAERLSSLRDSHPDLSVEFLVADWRDVAADTALDLWLSVTGDRPGTHVVLGRLRRVLVASPAYLRDRAAPQSIADLSAHQCVNYGYEARSSTWTLDGAEYRPTGFLRANSSEAVHRAVRGGLGIALLPRIQVEEDFASGRLVQLLPDVDIPSIAVAIVHSPLMTSMSMRVQAVRDFLMFHFPTERE